MEHDDLAPGNSGCACDAAPGASTALVLAGGGALGAYEAGVLLYALDRLPRERPVKPRLDIFAGTSAGALNVSFVASSARDLGTGARKLASFWETISMAKILRFGRRELVTMMRLVLGPGPGRIRLGRPRPLRHASHPPVAGLFNTSLLHEQMRELIAWDRLQRHIASGEVRGMALCATEVCTGTSIVFYQTAPGTEFRLGRDPNKEAIRVQLGVDHAMASAAIPFLFPSIQINGVCYTDGALRQNTPLNPALRMGADRVLVVSLTQRPGEAKTVARLGCRLNPYPGALFMLGKTAMVFMTQSLDYELHRVEMYNRLIRGGCEAYGHGFLETLNSILSTHRNASYRPVRTCHIRPSQNLNALAMEALRSAPHEIRLPGVAGRALTGLLTSASVAESELLGYLMFTPTFTKMLLELGQSDARARRDELAELFAG
jgi:NTE family protein